MSADGEDLEFNPFFQALQTRFQPQYEHAQQNCWLVCIPKASSLNGVNLTKQFVEMHLLQPSIFLRDQYTSVANGQRLQWQVENNSLQCSSHTLTVQVLAEELAYNRSLQQFKMFVLDRPLDPQYKPGVRGSSQPEDLLKQRRTFDEHRQLLQSFYKHGEVLKELDGKIVTFIQNYLVVEVESLLKDTAQKLEAIVKQISYAFLEANRRDSRIQDRRVQEVIRLSIEGYLMSSVHSKVYPAVRRVHAREDSEFINCCRELRGRLTPSQVGVQEDYNCPYAKTLGHLRRMEIVHAPLEKLYCLQDAMEAVMSDVKEHFAKTLRHGEPEPLASDDLVALLATIIVQSEDAQMISSLYYMENFRWSLSDSDKLSYVLVTFRTAVEYVRGPESRRLLPQKEAPVRKEVESVPPPNSSPPRQATPGPVSQALTESMAMMGGATEQRAVRNVRRGEGAGEDSELGPFLSLLMENDDTVSSSTFYRKR